jgi:hypothetical protein
MHPIFNSKYKYYQHTGIIVRAEQERKSTQKEITVGRCFLPLGVASCCASIQLVPYDAVNRNKFSIRQLPLFILTLTHYMFRPLRAILR